MANKTGIMAAKEFIPCKGVVFDKDGTLIDIWSMLGALARERFKRLSMRVREEALDSVAKCVGYDRETGKISPFGPLASAARRDEVAVTAGALFIAGIPWHRAYSIARESYDEADQSLDVTKDARLLPGAPELLKGLRDSGLALFIVTSDGRERAGKMLEHVGILSLFNEIITWEDVSQIKPDPESVLLCSRRSGIAPQDLVVIGDGPQDALMARGAGAKAVGVLTGVSSYDDLDGLCNIVVSSIQDIRPAE